MCNVWGWIHLYGVGELTDIKGRLTLDQYLEILEEVMLPTVRAMALPFPEQIVFVQVCVRCQHSVVYACEIHIVYFTCG